MQSRRGFLKRCLGAAVLAVTSSYLPGLLAKEKGPWDGYGVPEPRMLTREVLEEAAQAVWDSPLVGSKYIAVHPETQGKIREMLLDGGESVISGQQRIERGVAEYLEYAQVPITVHDDVPKGEIWMGRVVPRWDPDRPSWWDPDLERVWPDV